MANFHRTKPSNPAYWKIRRQNIKHTVSQDNDWSTRRQRNHGKTTLYVHAKPKPNTNPNPIDYSKYSIE